MEKTIDIYSRNRLFSFSGGEDWKLAATLQSAKPFAINDDRLTIDGIGYEFKASETWTAARSGMFGLSVVTERR